MQTINARITQRIVSADQARIECENGNLYAWAESGANVYLYKINGFDGFSILREPADFETLRDWCDVAAEMGDSLYGEMMGIAEYHAENACPDWHHPLYRF